MGIIVDLKLFTSKVNFFSGKQKPFETAKYVIFGVPFDSTSTYRTGSRFGPDAIRAASQNIETYSFRSGIDIEDIALYYAGDVEVLADVQQTIDITQLVVEEIIAEEKIPIAIGGEHTITLGIMSGLRNKAEKTAIVSFDAHLDMRNEFLGTKLSHATFMQMIKKQVKPRKIVEVGTRAVSREDLESAKRDDVSFFTAHDITEEGSKVIIEQLKEQLMPYEYLYLTVDMDVLDPAFAPAVQNPEPDGISTSTFLDIVCSLCDKRVLGFDVVEIVPVYDNGISAIVAAKTVLEMVCQLEKSRAK